MSCFSPAPLSLLLNTFTCDPPADIGHSKPANPPFSPQAGNTFPSPPPKLHSETSPPVCSFLRAACPIFPFLPAKQPSSFFFPGRQSSLAGFPHPCLPRTTTGTEPIKRMAFSHPFCFVLYAVFHFQSSGTKTKRRILPPSFLLRHTVCRLLPPGPNSLSPVRVASCGEVAFPLLANKINDMCSPSPFSLQKPTFFPSLVISPLFA